MGLRPTIAEIGTGGGLTYVHRGGRLHTGGQMRQDVITGQRSCLRAPEERRDAGKLGRGTGTVPCRALG